MHRCKISQRGADTECILHVPQLSASFHFLLSLAWVRGKCNGAVVTKPACWSESPRKLIKIYGYLDSTLRDSDSVGLVWGSGIFVFLSSYPGDSDAQPDLEMSSPEGTGLSGEKQTIKTESVTRVYTRSPKLSHPAQLKLCTIFPFPPGPSPWQPLQFNSTILYI